MDLMESYVLAYLTAKKHVFVNPQFSIRDEKGKLWSCPDFVALGQKRGRESFLDTAYRAACTPKPMSRRPRLATARAQPQILGELLDRLADDFKIPDDVEDFLIPYVKRCANEDSVQPVGTTSSLLIWLHPPLPNSISPREIFSLRLTSHPARYIVDHKELFKLCRGVAPV